MECQSRGGVAKRISLIHGHSGLGGVAKSKLASEAVEGELEAIVIDQGRRLAGAAECAIARAGYGA